MTCMLCRRDAIRFLRACTAAMITVTLLAGAAQVYGEEVGRDGSEARPLRVMLIPADTGADTTLDDFKPVFNAIEKNFGLHFDLRVGTSYGAVVEGLVARRVDIAFVGPVSFQQARKRNAAELLAVAVKDNSSSYRSAVLVRKDADIRRLRDLRGKLVALGDINSTSSFRYPIAMLLKENVDPVSQLERIVITGSHSNALAALREGHVDAAGCSLAAYEKAINSGAIDSGNFKIIAVSPPIPNPPLAMHPDLADPVKKKLREAFRDIHQAAGVNPEMIRGYGGDRYDRFDVEFPQKEFDDAIDQLSPVTPRLISSIIERSADR